MYDYAALLGVRVQKKKSTWWGGLILFVHFLFLNVPCFICSVLLDAGAGSKWKFDEPGTSVVAGSSEGLALASLHLFKAGGLSRYFL